MTNAKQIIARRIIARRNAFGRMKTTSKWVAPRTPWGMRVAGFVRFMPHIVVAVVNASGTVFHWAPSTGVVTAPTWE